MWRQFAQQVAYYLGYNFFIVTTSLILVSLVAFFHFLLDHRLGIVEEWIFQNSYQILILSKFISLMGILSFVNVRTTTRYPFKELLMKGSVFPHYKIFAISFLQIFIIIFLGAPRWEFNADISFFNIAISFIGTVLFYLFDVFLLVSLDNIIPMKGKLVFFSNFLYSVTFWGIAKLAFFRDSNIGDFILFNSFFCFYLARFGKSNWTLPLIWLALVVAPLASLMGMDMLWKNTYALFELTHKVDKKELFILFFVSTLYLSGMLAKWYNALKRRRYGSV